MNKHHTISEIYHRHRGSWSPGKRTVINRDHQVLNATCVVWSKSPCTSMACQGSESDKQSKNRAYWRKKGQGCKCFSKLRMGLHTQSCSMSCWSCCCSQFPTAAAGGHPDGRKKQTRLHSNVSFSLILNILIMYHDSLTWQQSHHWPHSFQSRFWEPD